MIQGSVKFLSGTLVLLFGLVPLILKTHPWLLQKVVFLNAVAFPPFQDVKNPDKHGIKGGKNFYLNVTTESTIGVWYIPPAELADIGNEEIVLKGDYPIFLYLHGNSGSRASYHRVQLMKLLASMNYHVFIMDYRGYADSHGVPSEYGVVQDAEYMYRWIKARSGTSPVYLWGHSLGTGIGLKLAKQLSENGESPAGLVLEAAFTNIKEAAANHPFSYIFRSLPWFYWAFIDPLDEAEVYFESDKNIASVTCDILILHAEDDISVPIRLGQNLFEAAKKSRPAYSKPVEFVAYGREGFGHNYIFTAPGLPDTIRSFVTRSVNVHD